MWVWTDNFWKGSKRRAGDPVDFSDPRVGPHKPRLIAEGRIIEKKKYGSKTKEGDD